MTNYRKTETTTIEYGVFDDTHRVVETTTVTEYEEHEPTIKPEDSHCTGTPATWSLEDWAWQAGQLRDPNASVYDLNRARARKTSQPAWTKPEPHPGLMHDEYPE